MKKAPAAPVKHPAKKSPPTRSAFLFLGFWPLLFACVIVTALVYAPSLENGWTNWDDNSYVIENELVRTTDLKTHFGTFQVMGNYHPLTMLTLAWDYASAGVEARGYHVTNLLLHLASTALLFVFLWQLFGSPFFRPSGNGDSQNKSANAAALAAAFGTLAFSIHPMHVESVAWISERKDVLYGFFYFATLVVWMRYRTGAQSPLLYATAIVLFACSLLSKGQAVTLPVVLVLVDWLQNRKWDAKAILEKVPFFLLALAFG
ncbi:MAG TPA: hypothetical protein VEY71_12960, partial [Chitinophagales bacterium]|nr:hypothetical protein [Chitinophagales bacterium]